MAMGVAPVGAHVVQPVVLGSVPAVLGRLFDGVSDQDRVAARAYMIAKLGGGGRIQVTHQELLAAGLSAQGQPAVVAGLAYLCAIGVRPFAYETALGPAFEEHARRAGCVVESRSEGILASVERFADEAGRVARATFGPAIGGVGTVIEDGVAKPLAAVGGGLELVIEAGVLKPLQQGVVQPITTVVRDGVVKPVAATLQGAAAAPLALVPGLEAVGKSLLSVVTLGFWRR